MTAYYITSTVMVDADSPEEAMAIVRASMPSSGAVRTHGTVGVITGVVIGSAGLGMATHPAVQIDAEDVRDVLRDDWYQWSEAAWQAVDGLPDSEINDTLRDGFGDDFWAAVSDVKQECIEKLLRVSGLPPEKGKDDTA